MLNSGQILSFLKLKNGKEAADDVHHQPKTSVA